ncbi:chromosomal replication initiator protein DnaA [Lawsonella clevelandensis]|uniref:chromosomal replication initiator protein DnaA n=1 Tax=Lawsonella clevelandensis TaxID=1528099 RepID=UPI002913423A|nr:chromosomal replication initiator protein DnaA [Lawsonella clevelandensis]MDU7192996.1 chromosomal replication initiator protein DnaA [Lawsonella clevelandensis]
MVTQTQDLHHIWGQVLDELETASANPYSTSPSLSPQQRAWLKLVEPIQYTNGFALLSAPNTFAKEAIERTLHEPITCALEKFLGEEVTLAVKVIEKTPATSADPNDSHVLLREALNANPVTGPWPRPPVVAQDRILPEDIPTYRPENMATPITRPQFPQGNAPATPDTASTPPASTIATDAQRAATQFTPTPPTSTEPTHTQSEATTDLDADRPQRDVTQKPPPPTATAPAEATPTPTLNPRYTFDNYVVGDSNRFATAAAWAISEAPAHAYNPLFIWGGSGLGKTHLLHAIGHYTHQLFPRLKVRYVSTEEFTNDFINSLRDDRKEKFKKRYRDCDLLLVDDIQFIEGKEGIQEEFFYTFEALHNSNKQIVISSDRPPALLSTLEDRLRTRFEWGLITDIQAPDLETRTAILRKKAQVEKLQVPNEVLELIASRIDRNIRELEGALIRVTAFASLNKQPLTPELAQVVLRDLVPADKQVQVTAATIMTVVAEAYSTSVDELCGPSKTRPLATARQIAMYLCRELTEMSLPKIGSTFGGRDHTTVMYAERKISKQIKDDRTVFTQVQQLTSNIKKRAELDQ